MTCGPAPHQTREAPRPVKLILYQRGEIREYSSAHPKGSLIIQKVESLLVHASGVLRWVPPPKLLDSLKTRGRAVELLYPAPVTLVVAFNGETLHPTRLLVPLEGEWIDPKSRTPALIFHGYPEYSGAPYQNLQGIGRLLKMLHALTGHPFQ